MICSPVAQDETNHKHLVRTMLIWHVLYFIGIDSSLNKLKVSETWQ